MSGELLYLGEGAEEEIDQTTIQCTSLLCACIPDLVRGGVGGERDFCLLFIFVFIICFCSVVVVIGIVLVFECMIVC